MRPSFSRRAFLKATAALVASSELGLPHEVAAKQPVTDLVDVNVSLGRWPFRRLPLDDTALLVAKLRKQGVTQAWAGSFEGLLQHDLAAVNARLVDECSHSGRHLLVPFGSINPALPGWEDDLRRCAEIHKMPGIRLNPNYHGYKLEDPACLRLLQLATHRKLIVQIVACIEDERTQNPLVRVPDTDLTNLPALLGAVPGSRVLLLNWFRTAKGALLEKLAKTLGLFFDIAMVESVDGISNLLRTVPLDRILFGSHAPLFYFESALLKLQESPLTSDQLRAVRTGNARRL
jgi:predicted TIM-barrel fold metal-dependent hydrolase